MQTIGTGETWKDAKGRAWLIIGLPDDHGVTLRAENDGTEKWITEARLRRAYTRVPRSTSPAQQSALGRVKAALENIQHHSPNAADVRKAEECLRALDSLVSEVREDCARIADNEAEVWAGASADMESSGRINDGAVAAMAIARRIRARKC